MSEKHRLRQAYKCVWYNDIDKYATAVYNHRFKEAHEPADIRKVRTADIPDFDMLCAGFPCQSFSIAGKRKGFQDTRGTLFFEICRIARDKRPQLLLLENVKGLLSHDEGNTFRIILESLDELGYDTEWQVLNSKHFGVPQNRERVFIIGHLGGFRGQQVFPIGESDENTVREYRKEKIKMIHGGVMRKGHYGNGIKDDLSFTVDKTCGRDLLIHNIYKGFGEGIRVFDKVSPTIRTPKGGGHLPMVAIKGDLTSRKNPQRQMGIREGEMFALRQAIQHNVMRGSKIRRLTPTECERLQGFPDNWTLVPFGSKQMSDTQRYKMMGNAVTVNVIETIGRRMLEVFHNGIYDKGE